MRLVAVVTLAVLTLTGSACWHSRHYTAIVNRTGQRISIVVHIDGDTLPAYGPLEVEQALSLRPHADSVALIEYEIDGQRCVLDRTAIRRAIRVDEQFQEQTIDLHACGGKNR